MVSGLPLGDRSIFNSIVHKLIVSEIATPMSLRGFPSRPPQALALALTVCPAGNIFAVSGTILFFATRTPTENAGDNPIQHLVHSYARMNIMEYACRYNGIKTQKVAEYLP